MSSINQDIRFSNVGPQNNPKALFDFIKPSRWIFNNVNPLPDTGEDQWFYINTATGDLFEKTSGTWFLVYNFSVTPGSGITNIQNETPGLFKNIIGTTAHFKGLAGDVVANEIFVDNSDSNTVFLSIEPSYKPISLSRVQNIYIGNGTFNPNGTVGATEGASQGSLFIQLPAILWVCQNPVTEVWTRTNSGILDIVNVGGPGEGLVIGVDVGGDGLFKKISSTGGDINVSSLSTSVDLNISPSFVPVLLDKVPNVYNNFSGNAFSPTVNDDITKGFQKGSIYTQLSGTVGDIWVCADNTTGAAVWRDVGQKTSVLKGYAQYSLTGSNYQTTFLNTLDRYTLNVGPIPFDVTISEGDWTSVIITPPYVVARRGPPLNGIPTNRYRYTMDAEFQIVAATVLETSPIYEIYVQNDAGDRPNDPVYPHSSLRFTFPEGTLVRHVTISNSFFFESATSATEYYNICIRNRSNTKPIFLERLKFNIEQLN